MSAKGESEAKSVSGAVAMIRATPQSDRSSFAREIWKRRRARGTDYTTRRAIAGKRKRRNPADESVEAYRDFHGREPDEMVTVTRRVHVHKHLAGAGELRKLFVKGVDRARHTISRFKGALLAFNEKRNQLFIEGGDQSINLGDFGITEPHELETLGKVVKIDYFTRKDHLGSEGGTATYRHGFATVNENGRPVRVKILRFPDLIYRVLEEQLEFSGGSYTILPEGIDR
jgi:hypothetical protein